MITKSIFTIAIGIFLNTGLASDLEKPDASRVQKIETQTDQKIAVTKVIHSQKAKQKCKAHKVIKENCFICDPKLREKGRMWCKEHERYEDRCFICHSELQDTKRMWCKEHSLYEDECFLCHPELKSKDATRTVP